MPQRRVEDARTPSFFQLTDRTLQINLMPDINLRESLILWVLVLALVWLGLYPQPVLDTAEPALDALQPFMKR